MTEQRTAKKQVGRLAKRPYQHGDPLPAVGSLCLVSGANCDVESDQHRSYSWCKVIGYTEDRQFVCLQTQGCWPTVERLANCWFGEIPTPAFEPPAPASKDQLAAAFQWVADVNRNMLALADEIERLQRENDKLRLEWGSLADEPDRTTDELRAECRDCDQLIGERDRAQDALQKTHIALGGDGEWVGRMPPQPAPDSGDLHIDVPELARDRMAELERLRAAQPPSELHAQVTAFADRLATDRTYDGDIVEDLRGILDGYPERAGVAPRANPWDGKRVYIIPVDLQDGSELATDAVLRANRITYWVDDPAPTKNSEVTK